MQNYSFTCAGAFKSSVPDLNCFVLYSVMYDENGLLKDGAEVRISPQRLRRHNIAHQQAGTHRDRKTPIPKFKLNTAEETSI